MGFGWFGRLWSGFRRVLRGSILCGNLCGIFSQFELFAGPSASKLTMEQWMALILSSPLRLAPFGPFRWCS